MRYLLILLALFGILGKIDAVEYSLDPGHFHHLNVTQQERDKIFKLISNMGTLPWPKLLLKKNAMEKLGDDIDHVHPMRFLGVIFSNPHLKYCMGEVEKSGLKWGRFIKGLSKKMKKNHEMGNILPHITGFAEETGVDPDQCYEYLIKKDYEGFVRYLIHA